MGNLTEYITNCGGFGLVWEVKINDFTAQKNRGYFIDTSNNPITITLPTNAEIGDGFYVVDSVGAVSESNRVVINSNGHNIMGLSDDLAITERYMNVFLVYADATKGWVIADGKGCNQDSTAGTITVPTTIYLAPSAASQSPTGVTGSDTTGDGSQDKPFFSIKRAMEYLENYSIKPGVYVTIRGLPGKYYYNDDHKVYSKHRDTKFIKIEFDMLDTVSYFNTQAVSGSITVVNNTDHDLVTMQLDSIGTGNQQIQIGDYVKVFDNVVEQSVQYNGYYKVTDVDTVNNKITIYFQRHQENGSYNPDVTYSFDSGTSNINVYKFSSHIYFTGTGTFFESHFGLGGMIAASSCENRYSADFLSVYDGIIEKLSLQLNNYYRGIYLKNLETGFNGTDNSILFTICTSCAVGIKSDGCSLYPNSTSTSNCKNGFILKSSSFTFSDVYYISTHTSHYSNGIESRGSYITGMPNNDYVNRFVLYFNRDGISLYSSTYTGGGLYVSNGYIGAYLVSSVISFFIELGSTTLKTHITKCEYGIRALSNSDVDVTFLSLHNNNQYGIVCDNSNMKCIDTGSQNFVVYDNQYGVSLINSDASLNYPYVYNNISYGVSLYNNSNLYIKNAYITGNGGDGIYGNGNCSVYILNDSYINNNSGNGVFITRECSCILFETSIQNNGSNGIYILDSSSLILENTSSTAHYVSGNANYNINSYRNSNARIIVSSSYSITNMTPAINTVPSYSGAVAGSYILYTEV